MAHDEAPAAPEEGVSILGADLDQWFQALENGDFARHYDEKMIEQREAWEKYEWGYYRQEATQPPADMS